jgi:hypothetical protein
MHSRLILVHDPYDVFLAVGFGFCYGSALLPAIRLLENAKTAVHIRARGCRWLALQGSILLRGGLTVLGLGCLYGWYAFYLKEFYPGEVPMWRHLLDWISLGLFAIGANYWDNRDHNETLYCIVEGLATTFFGLTCYLALPSAWNDNNLPLLKAIFWCTVVLCLYLCFMVGSWCFGKLAKAELPSRWKAFWIIVVLVSHLIAAAAIEWRVFCVLNLDDQVFRFLGIGLYIGASVIFLAALVLALLTENRMITSWIQSAILTMLPMALLIWVTFKNYHTLFHGN